MTRDSVKTAVVEIFEGHKTYYFKTTAKINLNYVQRISVFPAIAAQKAFIIERTRTILTDPDGPDASLLESEISQMIYSLYNLAISEIELVENDNKIRKDAQYDRMEPLLIHIFRRNKCLPSLSRHSRLDYFKAKEVCYGIVRRYGKRTKRKR